MTTVLRSGELADAAGVNHQTLRYYERRGLLPEPERSPGGHRLYPAEALTTLRVIKTAQRLGFTLDEVAELVDLGQHRHGRRRDRSLQTRAAAKLTEIETKIAHLQLIAASLRGGTRRWLRRPDHLRHDLLLPAPLRRPRPRRRSMTNNVRRILPGSLGGLTGLACALCCLIPVLLGAGVLGGAGWAVLGQILPGVAVALAAVTGLAWWWAKRRPAHARGCAGGDCACSTPA